MRNTIRQALIDLPFIALCAFLCMFTYTGLQYGRSPTAGVNALRDLNTKVSYDIMSNRSSFTAEQRIELYSASLKMGPLLAACDELASRAEDGWGQFNPVTRYRLVYMKSLASEQATRMASIRNQAMGTEPKVVLAESRR